MLAICGDNHYNLTWYRIWEGEGTTLAVLYCFIERIIIQLNVDHFTMDNLNIHHKQEILELIAKRGHCYTFKTSWCDGAIEYVSNQIHV